ncbi:hypothetical protein ACOMYX_19525 (plasmid) [Pantoea agglomerans]
MSQYRLEGITPTGTLEVLLGWDEPMNWFFLVIDPEADEPLYSNLDEPEPEHLTLDHFQRVLDRFNIKNISLCPGHEDGLYDKLMSDRKEKRMS